MALWDFKALLVPRQRLAAADLQKAADELLCGNSPEWHELELQKFVDQISIIFPEIGSWSPFTRRWGDENKVFVKCLIGKDAIEEGTLVVDMRNFRSSEIMPVLDVLSQLDLMILTSDKKFVAPNIHDVELVLRESPAWRFLCDPERFLEDSQNAPAE